MVVPFSCLLFLFLPVINNWRNQECVLQKHVCGVMHVNYFLLEIGQFPLKITMTSYNSDKTVLSASLNITFPALSLV